MILSSALLLLVVCVLAIQTECTREVKHCYLIRSECAGCMCAGNPKATEEDRKNCFCNLENGEYYLKPQVPLGVTSYCQPFRYACSAGEQPTQQGQLSVLSSAGEQPTQQGQLSVLSCLPYLLLVNSPHKVSYLSSQLLTV